MLSSLYQQLISTSKLDVDAVIRAMEASDDLPAQSLNNPE
jgi:hypothetical protein